MSVAQSLSASLIEIAQSLDDEYGLTRVNAARRLRIIARGLTDRRQQAAPLNDQASGYEGEAEVDKNQ